MNSSNARPSGDIGSSAPVTALAFYLPQFHRVPQNDLWWGDGFTEWTHLSRARTWFPGHRVRRPVPPLGSYNLLTPGTMEMQYQIAQSHGLHGFLVWDYWLGGGRQLLEKPIDHVLTQGLAFRYALAWANHSWTDRLRSRRLVEQQYLGRADYEAYFDRCLQHFVSDRYIRVNGKPLFFIYKPADIPDFDRFVDIWRERAHRRGLGGLFLVGDYIARSEVPSANLDAYSNAFGFWTNWKKLGPNIVKEKLRTLAGIQTAPQRFDFARMLRDFIPSNPPPNYVPTVFTGWDTTPRHGRNGVIFDGLTQASFRAHLALSKPQLMRADAHQRILLVKSWNEWAEGNLLEPDSVFGDDLLKVLGSFLSEINRDSASPSAEAACGLCPRQSRSTVPFK